MLIPTIIMGVLAAVLFFLGYTKGGGQHVVGLKSAAGMIVQMLPLLVFALIVAGMIRVLLPQEFLSKWVGTGSGLRGIILGTIAGGLSPGGPYVSLPIVAGLLKGPLGWWGFIPLVLFGHTFNFFISILGGFVHSARLIFVEFFGRFYSGGAPAFVPFGQEPGRVRLIEEG